MMAGLDGIDVKLISIYSNIRGVQLDNSIPNHFACGVTLYRVGPYCVHIAQFLCGVAVRRTRI